METSAELLYLLDWDKRNIFGFDDRLNRSELQQYLFFWHGSGAPYQGNLGFFRRAKEQSACKLMSFVVAMLLRYSAPSMWVTDLVVACQLL